MGRLDPLVSKIAFSFCIFFFYFFFFFFFFLFFFFFFLLTTSKRKKFLHNGRRQPKARLWVDKAVQRAGDSRGQRSGDVYLDRRNWRYSAKQNSHSRNGASFPK